MGSPGPSPSGSRPYRFGFVLTTTLGNMTRYQNLRKYAERDPEIEFTWAPVSHYTSPDVPSRLRFLPPPLFMRARVFQQAWPVLGQLGRFDAVMIHLFEADVLCALRSCLRPLPLRFSSTDEAPITNRATYPLYPSEMAKPPWRHKIRLAIDRWRVRHTDYFVPFTRWAGDILVRDCAAPADRVFAMHVGMDLELWQAPPKQARVNGERLKLLFVGGDFERKGGLLLLEIFDAHFRDVAELHVVSKQAPAGVPQNVHVHTDFEPNDARLRQLYAEVDAMVVPSTADIIPWAFLEAMAMRLPVIATRVGATTEVVRDGETGYAVPIGDAQALRTAIRRLVDDPALVRRLGDRGREIIDEHYDAAKNVPAILQMMKDAVDSAGRPRH